MAVHRTDTSIAELPEGRTMPLLTPADANAILAESFAAWVLALDIRADAVTADSATLRIPFSDRICRVGGIVCGQALASGADTAMVIALAAAMGGLKPCTTVDMSISFMRPITSRDTILAAKVMRLGKSLAFTTCEIAAEGEPKPAAFATGTYAILA